MSTLLSDAAVIERVFDHIDNKTTDTGDDVWKEPVEHYRSETRLTEELALFRRIPLPFCPSAALPEAGSYVARTAAGTPILAVRGDDGEVRAFRNACRHRGMQVAQGSGCNRAFVCRYHGWTYRLDGELVQVPHEAGFPNLNKADHSLVPVTAEERHGLVFVTQETPVGEGAFEGLDALSELLSEDQQIFHSAEHDQPLNWKLNLEGNLEGYHIKPTHKTTFYPYGFDNLNVVETFGNNCRVIYPFRRIEKLRNIAPAERNIAGMVTFVYQIFPNVTVAVLSNHTSVSFAEPLTPSSTRFTSYRFTNRDNVSDKARAVRDASFVSDGGAKEDAEVVQAIQNSLASGANEHFLFGHYEKAIVHFHQTLSGLLARAAP